MLSAQEHYWHGPCFEELTVVNGYWDEWDLHRLGTWASQARTAVYRRICNADCRAELANRLLVFARWLLCISGVHAVNPGSPQ